MNRFKDVMSSWSSQDPESRNGLLLIAGISAIILLAVGVIAFGFYRERIAAKHDAVLSVGSTDITYGDLEQRLKYELTGVTSLTNDQFANVVSSVLISMENEQLVRMIATERGLTANEEEIEAKIREELGISPEATREVYASRLRRELMSNNLSLSEYKELARSLILETKVRDSIAEQIPSTSEQVDLRILQLSTREEIDAAKQRLDAGDTLGVLAAQLSIHSSSQSAGEMGWIPRGALPAEVEDFAWIAEPGTFSDVIETPSDGFFLAEVRGKQEREVSEGARDYVVSYQLLTSVRALRDEIGSEFKLTNGQLSDLSRSIASYLSSAGG